MQLITLTMSLKIADLNEFRFTKTTFVVDLKPPALCNFTCCHPINGC